MSNEVYGFTQADVEAGYQIDSYTLTELTVDESGLKTALFTKGNSQVAAFTVLCVVSLSYTDPWAWSGCRRATVR